MFQIRRIVATGLLLFAALSAHAVEVQIDNGGGTLNGNLELAPDRSLEDGIILMLHGTLGHNKMEIMETLQSVLMEYGYSSLAVNLSLDIDNRHGFYPCDRPHTHEYQDAFAELELWLSWLDGQDVGDVVLLGHSRGGNQVANFLLARPRMVRAAILIAPSAGAGPRLNAITENIEKAATTEWLSDVDFLNCKNAKVSGESYLSYYQTAGLSNTPEVLKTIGTPTLVFSGSHDTVVTGLAEKMPGLNNDLVSYVEIDGADHFFRDLFAYDVVEASIDFLKSLQSIQPAVSLDRDSRSVSQNHRPIVIFVSQHGCQFCEILRKQVLLPMLRAGELDGKVILREVSLDSGFQLRDFTGERIGGSSFARRYDAEITPTILFLDGSGQEVADRIVGVGNIEYYGFYLDKAIAAATKVIAAAALNTKIKTGELE